MISASSIQICKTEYLQQIVRIRFVQDTAAGVSESDRLFSNSC
jgi:ABC-type enterochelin transport system permease subunit